MKTINNRDYVEKYLEGKLKDGDLWEFKHRVEKESELAKELQLQQEINETLSDNHKMQIRRNLHKAYMRTSYVYSFVSKWKLQAVAAAVVIMMLIGGGVMFNYLQSSSLSNMALYEQYFDVDNNMFTVRAGDANLNNSITDGIDAFNNNEYLEAIRLFDKHDNNMAANLYSGFSFMKLSDYENAKYKFTQILKDNNSLFIDQAEFNLALCFVATNELEKAKQMLKVIIKEKTVYATKAKEMIKEIR